MPKPAHQWETARHRAYRLDEVPSSPLEGDPRAEVLELRFDNGATGRVECGLERQILHVAGEDPQLRGAVAAWLIARGQRSIALESVTPLAGRPAGKVLERGSITPAELGDPPAEHRPRRVITLAPSNLEAVAALGRFEDVVACEDSSDWPEGVESLERLGPDLGPDLERVAALEPDLVVSSLTVPGMERVVTGLRKRGIRQCVLAPRSITDVLDGMTRLGAHLHARDEAERVVAEMREQMAQLEASLPAEPTRVYLEWWPKPMFTPGADCYSNELIRLAGGINVFGQRPGSSLEISAEELLAAAPEVCFVSWCGVARDKLDPQRLVGRPGLGELEAGRTGRVYPLDEAFSGRPGPRMLEAARIMAEAIQRRDAS